MDTLLQTWSLRLAETVAGMLAAPDTTKGFSHLTRDVLPESYAPTTWRDAVCAELCAEGIATLAIAPSAAFAVSSSCFVLHNGKQIALLSFSPTGVTVTGATGQSAHFALRAAAAAARLKTKRHQKEGRP